jgi:hypothetical protein
MAADRTITDRELLEESVRHLESVLARVQRALEILRQPADAAVLLDQIDEAVAILTEVVGDDD